MIENPNNSNNKGVLYSERRNKSMNLFKSLLNDNNNTSNKYILKGDNITIKEPRLLNIKTILSNKKNINLEEKTGNNNTITTNINNINNINSKIPGEEINYPINYPYTLKEIRKENRGSFSSSRMPNNDDGKSEIINSASSGGNSHNSDNGKNTKDNFLTQKRKFSTEFMAFLYNKGVAKNINTNPYITNIKEIKISKDNPYCYSYNQLHPFSFFYGTKYKDLFNKQKELNLPAPRLIDLEEWMKEKDMSKKSIFEGTKIDPKLGCVITDPVVMEKYKGLLTDIIFQILKVPFGHHISLNIKMFEPKCLQERFSYVFSYAPKYLGLASDKDLNPIARFKYFITFMTSAIYTVASQLKPFNPFLGETFQGEFPNGDKLYLEQVTHNPLSTRFYMKHKNIYELSGYLNFSVKSESLGSNMYIIEKGPIKIKFLELGEELIGTFPFIKIVNASSEKNRATAFEGNPVFVDVKNGLKAVIKYNTDKKEVGFIIGKIFYYNYGKDYKFDYDKEAEFAKKLKLKSLPYKCISDITGIYYSNLFFNKKLYWDIDAQNPCFIRPCRSCLPSDGRFREDLIWLYRSFYCSRNDSEKKVYQNIAQEWKILMEEFNRWERKRRNDLRPAILKALKKKNLEINKKKTKKN